MELEIHGKDGKSTGKKAKLNDAVFAIGPYSFKPAAKMLVRGDNRKIHLTEKETAILRFLYRAGRKPIAREVLHDDPNVRSFRTMVVMREIVGGP